MLNFIHNSRILLKDEIDLYLEFWKNNKNVKRLRKQIIICLSNLIHIQ